MRKLITVLFMLLPTQLVFGQSDTSMVIDLNSITGSAPSGESIELIGTASNEIEYEASISCIPKERNSSGIDQGFIHVLQSPTHVGVSTNFEYDECIELIKQISEGEVKVLLEWNQKELENIITGKLEWEVL